MNSITILERIAMHQSSINCLNTIRDMMVIEKENIGDTKREAARIRKKAAEQYAELIKLLCQVHIEHALENEAYSAAFSNSLS